MWEEVGRLFLHGGDLVVGATGRWLGIFSASEGL